MLVLRFMNRIILKKNLLIDYVNEFNLFNIIYFH